MFAALRPRAASALVCTLASALALAACGERPDATPAPDLETQARPAPPVSTTGEAPVEQDSPAPAEPITPGGMIAAAHPLAVEAGLDILRQGGSAADAAIAVQTTLSLVEPHSSGVGGGLMAVYFHAETGEITVYMGRETAPASATPERFRDENGERLGFLDARESGLSTGAPAAMDALALFHEDHGALAWDAGFTFAAQTAREGFEVTARLTRMLTLAERRGLSNDPMARTIYFDEEGAPLQPGALLQNPAFAQSMDALAANPRALLEGPIAQAIVERVNQEPRPGGLTLADLAAYRAERVDPVCARYRENTVCGAPPPSSGGVAVAQALMLLDGQSFLPGGAQEPRNWAILAEAMRHAYADRDQYVADPQFVDVPIAGLLDPAYVATRAGLMNPEGPAETITAGDPWPYMQADPELLGEDATDDRPGTTHFVIVDGQGNVASVTSTVESFFGSGRMVGGFFLNNQLTDFSFAPVDADGLPIANAVAPGKRPRSSMSPTIVLDEDGNFRFATGSPGGNSIIAYTLKSLVGVLDWGLSPQDAAALPNMIARADRFTMEGGEVAEPIRAHLTAVGFPLSERPAGENSGIHSVLLQPSGELVGAADPRREGVVGEP